MIDLSLAGIPTTVSGASGSPTGIVAAAFAYGPVVRTVEHWLGASGGPDEHATAELALLRRAVLAADILLFAGVGYWFASALAG